MGKTWDGWGSPASYQRWCVAWAREALRVAKPGAHLLAFGGTRTYHRLASAIEDAGWEIRDCLVWAYASGFPKSLDVSKAIDKAAGALAHEGHGFTVAGRTDKNLPNPVVDGYIPPAPATDAAREWDGWGTALKPAWEPIVMARKPLRGTVAANVQQYGTGALNIDATRIGTGDGGNRDGEPSANRRYGEQGIGFQPTPGPRGGDVSGRWPANLILTDPIFDGDYPDEVVGGGDAKSGYMSPDQERQASYGEGGYHGGFVQPPSPAGTYGDSGGKSRFFMLPKAARSEREGGLQGREAGNVGGRSRADGRQWDIPGSYTDNGKKQRVNIHPTVKPVDLMRHLVRLVSPPDGVVLDPFIGSGTTAIATSAEGFRCIGIEKEASYLDIAVGRLAVAPIGMGL